MREIDLVITGAAGFLGSHICHRLRDELPSTLVVDRAAPSFPCHFHVTDLADPQQLFPPLIQPAESFSLIHLAWATDRRRVFADHADHVNRLARLIDHWGPRGLSRVVVAGTAEEFGGRGGRLDGDSAPLGPLSPYGWGKASAREMLRNWSESQGRIGLWLRPFLVYGPGQTGSMLIPYALRQAMSEKHATFSDGLQQRDFLHVHDVAAAFKAALEFNEPGFHVFNLGTGQAVAVREVLTFLAACLAKHECFRFGTIKRRPNEPDVQVANPTEAEAALGWKSRISWRDGIKDLCAIHLKEHSWAA